jgi:hypothetical protein
LAAKQLLRKLIVFSGQRIDRSEIIARAYMIESSCDGAGEGRALMSFIEDFNAVR